MKKTFGVFVFDEHAEGPTYAVIEIDEDLIQRILELQVAVKKSHAWRIQTHHDDALIFYDGDPEDDGELWDGEVELISLDVTGDSYAWTGYIKHTGILIETEMSPISDLIAERKEIVQHESIL